MRSTEWVEIDHAQPCLLHEHHRSSVITLSHVLVSINEPKSSPDPVALRPARNVLIGVLRHPLDRMP